MCRNIRCDVFFAFTGFMGWELNKAFAIPFSFGCNYSHGLLQGRSCLISALLKWVSPVQQKSSFTMPKALVSMIIFQPYQTKATIRLLWMIQFAQLLLYLIQQFSVSMYGATPNQNLPNSFVKTKR